VQTDGAIIDQFVTEPKSLARSCEFGEQRESMIRDRLVFGILDNRLKQHLLSSVLSRLQSALDTCRAAEASQKQVNMVKEITGKSANTNANADAVHSKPRETNSTEI
jgi:hypothetical protein